MGVLDTGEYGGAREEIHKSNGDELNGEEKV